MITQIYTETPKSKKESTSKGCECIYFSNGNGTGWKTFYEKEKAELAWATQIWAVRKGIAPLVLSGIKEIDINSNYRPNFECPISGKSINYYQGVYEVYNNSYYTVNCSEIYKNIKRFQYGFLTEEISIIADDIDDDLYDLCVGSDWYFQKILNIGYFDHHSENWGILENRMLFIDFGSHFSRNLSDKNKQEIEKIKTQCYRNINVL